VTNLGCMHLLIGSAIEKCGSTLNTGITHISMMTVMAHAVGEQTQNSVMKRDPKVVIAAELLKAVREMRTS